MPGTRVDLQQRLEQVLGSKSVFFQPPVNLVLKYPCIVYEYSRSVADHADNIPYRVSHQYTVTFITTNPDDKTIERLSDQSYTYFNRYYKSDNLHHYVYLMYR